MSWVKAGSLRLLGDRSSNPSISCCRQGDRRVSAELHLYKVTNLNTNVLGITRGIEKLIKIKGFKENISCFHPKEVEEAGQFLPMAQHIYRNWFKNKKFTDRKKTIVQSRLKCPDTVGAKSSLVLLSKVDLALFWSLDSNRAMILLCTLQPALQAEDGCGVRNACKRCPCATSIILMTLYKLGFIFPYTKPKEIGSQVAVLIK